MGTSKKGISLPENVILVGKMLTFRMVHNKRVIKRSLKLEYVGTVAELKCIRELASEKANELRRNVLDGSIEARLREDAGKDSVQDLLDAFIKHAKTHTSSRTGKPMRQRTISDYQAVCKKLARFRFGNKSLESIGIDDLFDPDLLRDWKRHKVEKATAKARKFPDEEDAIFYKALNAAHSDANQIKSLWSIEAMASSYYRELLFDRSAIDEFKATRIGKPKARKFAPPSRETREAFYDFWDKMEAFRPDIWFAITLTFTVALRRTDAAKAKWDYINDTTIDSMQPDGSFAPARVIFFEYTGAKRGEIMPTIPVPIYERMLALKKPDQDYIIPLPNYTLRYELFEELSEFLKDIGITDARPCHYLRKWQGAIQWTLHGPAAAAAQLGNADIRTIQNTYSAYLASDRAGKVI